MNIGKFMQNTISTSTKKLHTSLDRAEMKKNNG